MAGQLHDSKKWGPLRANTQAREKLARLADVVEHIREREDLAQGAAAKAVLDRLPASGLYILNPTGDAAAVGDRIACDDWPAGYDHLFRPVVERSFWERESAEPPEYQSLKGIAGVMTWLRKYWVEQATADTDLNEGFGGPLAMLASDAAELLGFGGQVGSVAAGPVLTLIQSNSQADQKAAIAAAIAAAKPPDGFTKGGGWSTYRAALLEQYERLCEACQSSEAALIHLHDGWGYSKADDKSGGPLAKVLTRARRERAEAAGTQHLHRAGKRRGYAGG